MAWRLSGTFFQSCSCETICPCTWSRFSAKATLDRCLALFAYHVESGAIDDIDVGGLSFAYFIDSPPVMSEGNWRVGLYLDETASDCQAEALAVVLFGQAGGPPASLSPLIGEVLGIERARITYIDEGHEHRVVTDDDIDVELCDFVAIEGQEPVQLAQVMHPSNTTLTVSPTRSAKLRTFGIDWGWAGQNGFSASFSWSGLPRAPALTAVALARGRLVQQRARRAGEELIVGTGPLERPVQVAVLREPEHCHAPLSLVHLGDRRRDPSGNPAKLTCVHSAASRRCGRRNRTSQGRRKATARTLGIFLMYVAPARAQQPRTARLPGRPWPGCSLRTAAECSRRNWSRPCSPG